MIFLSALWAKVSGWVLGFVSLLAAVGVLVFYGYRKGSDSVAAKDEAAHAQQQINTATAVASRVETHAEIIAEVSQLPASTVPATAAPGVAPVVPVPGSAADKLQQEFSRD